MMKAADLAAIRAIITRAKRWDLFFSLLGILSLMVGLLTFAVLFIDMAIQGVPRLSYEFFTSFPSRRAENAGILSAWVGTILVMLVTALSAVPLGVAGTDWRAFAARLPGGGAMTGMEGRTTDGTVRLRATDVARVDMFDAELASGRAGLASLDGLAPRTEAVLTVEPAR